MAIIEDLERLAQLRERGILSEEEFQQEKQKLLKQTEWKTPIQETVLAPPSLPTVELPLRSETHPAREPNKKNPRKGAVRTLALAVAVIVGGILIIRMIVSVMQGSPSGPSGRLQQMVLMNPDPVVTQQNVDDSESSIWDFSRSLTGRVRNKGGDGYVLIKGCLQQGGKYFEREERRYLNREEECGVKYTFDEVTAGGGDMRAWIEVYPAQ